MKNSKFKKICACVIGTTAVLPTACFVNDTLAPDKNIPHLVIEFVAAGILWALTFLFQCDWSGYDSEEW